MLAEDRGGLVGVAFHRGLQQGLVLGMHVARDRLQEQRQAAVALGLLVQDGQEMLDPARRAGGNQHLVEDPVAFFPFLPVVDADPLFLRLAETVEGGEQVALPGVVAHRDRLAQGFALQHHAGPRDVGEVLDRHRGDAETALSLADDQRIGDQQRQRLAQRAGADAVVVLQVLDAQFLAGRQAAFDDVPPQVAVGGFDQGLRFGGAGIGG